METGYFFCGDILGFSKIVRNLPSSALDTKIQEWVDLVGSAAKKFNISKIQLLSDTVFASVEVNQLERLINFSRKLLNDGIKKSLPIRGAISYGKYNWGDLVYGPAVIAAHGLEKRQAWVGVTLDSEINISKIQCNDLGLTCYPVPMPGTEIRNYYALSWDVPRFDTLTSQLTSNGLGGVPGEGENLKWDFGDKIGNTILFGVYQEALRAKKKSGYKFCGKHPIHFIDLTLRK